MNGSALRRLALAAGWLAGFAFGLPMPAAAQSAAGQPTSIYAPGHAQEWSTRSGPPVIVAPPAAGTLFGPSYGGAPNYPSAGAGYYPAPGQSGSYTPNVVPGWGGLPPSGPVANPYPNQYPPPVYRNNGGTYYRR